MKTSRSKREPVTAAELSRQVHQDPAYVARMKEAAEERDASIQEHRRQAAPIIEELYNAGFDVQSLDELRRSGMRYTAAIPILIKWLPRISDADLKDSIVRTLSVSWAKQAAPALIEEFRNAPDTPPGETTRKWAIGNALSIVANDSVFTEIVDLVQDKRHARDREMLAFALGNKANEKAVSLLIELLEDDEVAGHAIVALGKLKAKRAEQYIEQFTSHPKAWVRREAKKALKKIRQA